MNRFFGIIIFVFAFFATTSATYGQSMSLTPNSGTIGVGNTETITITAENVGSTGVNSAAIRINVPSTVQITGFTDPSGDLLTVVGSGCSSKFTATAICVDTSNASAYTNGQVIGTFTVQGVSNSNTTFTYASGNRLQSPTDSYPSNGNAAEFTIGTGGASVSGSTGSTLPETALIDEVTDIYLLAAVIILLGGAILYAEFKHNIFFKLGLSANPLAQEKTLQRNKDSILNKLEE